MRFRTELIIGLAVRLAIAPFFAHPFDVYEWYANGQNFVSGIVPFWRFFVPYSYSLFLFAFPATLLFDLLSKFVTTFSIPMSSPDTLLNPGASLNITVIPGILFDLLVKLPLVTSDALIAYLLYKLVKHVADEESAVFVSALWFLNPLTIWISSGWGMFDTLPTLFTLIALYLVLQKRFELASISIAVAVAMKYYAVVLVIPLLILSFTNGGKIRTAKVLIYTAMSGAILFLPYLSGVVTGLTQTINGESTTEIHYSGLSFWSALTLFYSDFNQALIASLLIVVSLGLSYVWIWKHRRMQDVTTLSIVAFFLPVGCLLLFYQFTGMNFFVWILPFAAILSTKDIWWTRLYWILSLLVLVSSVTDGLLPYYMLPIYPWMGGFLVHAMNMLTPYRVAPTGSVAQGFSIGKIYLASSGILAFILVALMMVRLVIRKHP
ncbi:MAG: hypothetical protein M1587_01815 [Thaumarchaeota archaeon]|nr:hypothetical protein [Nitrososphaerota archaeon]